MRRLISAVALSFMLVGPAYAFQCPSDVSKIDAALPNAELSEEERAMVIELRNQGEAQHNAGQHQEAVDTLAQAKEILGIQ